MELLGLSESQLYSLRYEDSQGNEVKIDMHISNLLHSFKSFVKFHKFQNNCISDDDWVHITADEFNEFHINIYNPDAAIDRE